LRGLGRWRRTGGASFRHEFVQPCLKIADAIRDSGYLFAQISRQRIRLYQRDNRHDKDRTNQKE
jgi:hypothetical protein